MLRLRTRELARARGISLDDFQQALGLKMTTTKRYYYGTATATIHGPPLPHIDVATLEKIRDLFGVTLDELFEDVKEEE